MKSNIQEALRAKSNAEKLFAVKDFVAARNYAVEAQMLCPQLEGISQMVATFDTYCAAERKFGGEIDFYAVLGQEPSAHKSKLKKQYKKMAVLLHPDNNKTVGAEGAFKLVCEAWTLLSDRAKRRSYDLRRNKQLSCAVIQTNVSSVHGSVVTGFDNSSSSLSSHRLDTFWTICTSCHVQYEYLRKYVNKKLSCKNCRGIFIAVETGTAPINGSFPYSAWQYASDNGYGSHNYNGVSYIPNTAVCFTGNGSTGVHSGHASECVSNMSFHWGSSPGPSAGVVEQSGLAPKSANVVQQANGSISSSKVSVKHMGSNGHSGTGEPKKRGRPAKKTKVDVSHTSQHESEEMATRAAESEAKLSHGYGDSKNNLKISTLGETSFKRWSAAPAFDARQLLIDKARTVIRRKLEEMRLATVRAADAALAVNEKAESHVGVFGEAPCQETGSAGLNHQSELQKALSVPITVPDSDFHDFDKDRTEECFKPKQIWALYDEEDGMPRLYCLIRQVISVKPFKVHISYLSSKTDTEFGSVNWLDSGFTKSCGHFRAFNTDILEQVNIFSHLLSREKAGRGGCVRIYPKSGDIWAVYRNWSTNWNRTTPGNVRHQYEMVEVLDDYSEELGCCVAPLIKLNGFKTVYQRNTNKDAIRWIPRREMLRFSHQVPSCLLKGNVTNLPEGCWDLDPAATPDELLQAVTEVKAEKPRKMEDCAGIPVESLQTDMEVLVEEKQPFSAETQEAGTAAESFQNLNEVQVEKTPGEVLRDLNEVQVEKNPVEVLQELNEVQVEEPCHIENCVATPMELLYPFMEVQVEENYPFQADLQAISEVHEEKPYQMEHCARSPVDGFQPEVEVLDEERQPFSAETQEDASAAGFYEYLNEMQVEKTPSEVLQDLNEVQVEKSPFEVLRDLNELQVEKPYHIENCVETPMELFYPSMEVVPVEETYPFQAENSSSSYVKLGQGVTEVQMEKLFQMENCTATSMELLHTVMGGHVESKQPFQAENPAAPPSEFLKGLTEEVPQEKAPYQAKKVRFEGFFKR